MKVLVLGGAGMVGQKLLHRLADGADVPNMSELLVHDVVAPKFMPNHVEASNMVGDYSQQAETLAAARPDLIFHLASIVSGEAETNFEKGWEINMRGTLRLLEALRHEYEASGGAYRPKLIFASSIAVFGGPFPDKIGDEFLSAPLTSYGSQKAAIELLVSDYSRKGYIDGMSLRLPTIAVRPGKPNLAASSFFSGIIREPLNGQEAILPVSDSVRHWFASPRSAAGFFVHAANLDTSQLNDRRALNLPGFSCTVAEQIEALRSLAGENVTALIRPQRDEAIETIVSGWPRNFDPQRARALGFKAEKSFEEIIQVYMDEELA